ncbi:MAG: hypothetical protein JO209_07340 [Acidisphaera sp.]|nr:hypothetical protein [Acidisphaera sp.]
MVFAIWCTDRPASLDLRLATRPARLADPRTCRGRIELGGPPLDPDGQPCRGLPVRR